VRPLAQRAGPSDIALTLDACRYNFQQKILYSAVMMRRIIYAILDPSFIDDRCAAWGSTGPGLRPVGGQGLAWGRWLACALACSDRA
jgi:hypothetical protein